MLVFADRVLVATGTQGTGDVTIGAAPAGFQDFADAGVPDASQVPFVIRDGSDIEVCIGTYSAGPPQTLSRDTVLRSLVSGVAGMAKLDLSGNAEVFVTLPASEIVARSGAEFTGDVKTSESFEATKELAGKQVLGSPVVVLTGTAITLNMADGTRFEVTPTGDAVITVDPAGMSVSDAREATCLVEVVNSGGHEVTWAGAAGVDLRTVDGAQPPEPAAGQTNLYTVARKELLTVDLLAGAVNMVAL